MQSGDRDKDTPEADYREEAATASRPVSAEFAADTGERLKRGAIIGAVLLGAGFLLVSADRYFHARNVVREAARAGNALPLVDVVVAQRTGSVQRMILPGYSEAWHASTIYARVNGYVARWFVDIGDHVHGGQELALIETPDLDAQLAAARAQLRAGQATLLVRKAETGFALTTYERWRDSPKGVVSEQEREEKKASYDGAVARQKSAEADVALAEARVDQYAALTQFKRVTAPYDGVITARDIDIGNLVTADSTSATTPLYVMTQNDPIRIFVDAPQSAAADLMNGNAPVEVETSNGVSRQYRGRVTRTSQAINPQARTLRVEIDIPNPQGEFVPGMYLKVGFELAPRGLVRVPAAALIFRAGGPQVARVQRSGRVEFRNVAIGRDDGNIVELSSGVSPGDLLALNISSQIADGELVRARAVRGSADTVAAAEN